MTLFPVDVAASGAVLLGPHVTCDGFQRDSQVRVQSHVHDDHMDNFETSKGFQDIYMTEPTRELLIAEFNADLGVRNNLYALPTRSPHAIDDYKLTLVSSDHMLGAVQIQVDLSDGMRVGYSGDFHWPLDEVIQVDALVVDSTYGNPQSRRSYSQGEAEEKLIEIVTSALKRGAVHIKAARGTLARALNALSGNVPYAMVGSPRLCGEIDVYKKFGYGVDPVLSTESSEGETALAEPRYLRFYGKGDRLPVEILDGATVTLSAYMARPDDPLLEYSERAFRVALSNHADFDGTLEYVRATGAKHVVADNTRGGHAIELAAEIERHLGIDARPSSNVFSHEWGK